MKKIDIGQTITVLANVGVIAGIIFLGFELQQNNALMESEARRNRSAYGEQANLLMASDGELASIILKDYEGESLSALESFRAQRFWFAALTNMEIGYFDLSIEELETQMMRWRRFFDRNPALHVIWADNSNVFNPDFVTWVNEEVLVSSQ
jgi:hypothetical protein